MKKFKILIPVYNDWESLTKLLDEINKVVADIKNVEFDCMVVNDASTINPPEIKVPPKIKKIYLCIYIFIFVITVYLCICFNNTN